MIYAVVITYRAPEKLRTCLDFLKGQYDEIHVQDNSEENILYTKGINVGIRKALAARAKYVLIVCDDVKVLPGAVSEMRNYLEENPSCAIAMPIQVGKDGSVNCGGCTQAFPYGRHVCEPLSHELYREPFESYWANGACFLLRAEAVRECGLLDENMRFICSDADYSFTLRARGHKVFVVPTAIVEHEADGALNYKNPFIEKTKDEDSLYFIKKWLTGGIFQEIACEGRTLKAQAIANQYSLLDNRIKTHDYDKEARDVQERSTQA